MNTILGFFPSLPIRIPHSPGVPLWWDPLWWLFQIVVSGLIVFIYTRIGSQVDQDYGEVSQKSKTGPSEP